MNKETITIEDCLEMFHMRDCRVILENGQVIGFEKGECNEQHNDSCK